MGCVLHFSGEVVELEQLMVICPVEPCTVFRKGEPRSSRPNSRLCRISGLNIEVSNADFEEFEAQQKDAIAFLRMHHSQIKAMRQVSGVSRACLDFGIAMRNVVSQSDQFDAELISLLGPLNVALVLSQYPVGKKDKKVKQYRRALRKMA